MSTQGNAYFGALAKCPNCLKTMTTSGFDDFLIFDFCPSCHYFHYDTEHSQMMLSRVLSLQYIKEAFDVTKLAHINDIIKSRLSAGEETLEPSFCSVAMEENGFRISNFCKVSSLYQFIELPRYYNYLYRSEKPSSRQIVRGQITNLKCSLKDDDFQDYLANVSPAVDVFLFLCASNPSFADKCHENGYTLPHIDDIRLDRWFCSIPF
ncbi:hypothetical protein [Vibrio sp. 10N.239.312.D08]|uniref:hypothetical protein n=1 Tax=Vibrio sp. 10N.239.312.D08 TaxID=3229978 RepID=UPI00354E8C8B